MKKVFLFFFWFIYLAGYGQCPTEPVVLSTQAEITAFVTNYPNCTQILNGLTIESNQIIDLSPLSILTEIYGTLKIEYAYNLITLDGLENITAINNGSLIIKDNSKLISLSGLSGITGIIEGNVQIDSNELLENLGGLEGITGATHDLIIQWNNSLYNLTGLDGFETCDKTWIQYNPALVNLNGLDNLIAVEGRISINENNLLETLEALQNLQSIYLRRLSISRNNSLTNLIGLDNIENIQTIHIDGNIALTTLEGLQEIRVTEMVSIVGNPVLQSLNNLISSVEYVDICEVIIGNNLSLDTLEGLFDASSTDITLDNLEIKDSPGLVDFSGLERITEIKFLTVNNNESLEYFNGLQEVLLERILIRDNPVLISMQGLVGPNSTVRVRLYNNQSLIDLYGLEMATALRNVEIVDCESLQNLNALQGIERIYGYIHISGNPSLESLNGLSGIILDGLSVHSNDSLLNLDGVEGLNNIDDRLIMIGSNPLLQDISALSYITKHPLSSFSIANNPNLSMCSIFSVCNDLGHSWMSIGNNGPGCNSISEIEDNCNLNLNVIKGNAKYDFSLDGCDTGDYNISSV